MVRETNKVGCFLRLRVVDAEEKSYNICIPKGRGERGGWSVMADVVRDLIDRLDKKENTKEETTPRRLHVEMGKRWGNRDRLSVRVEIEGEEINRNMSRLGHCLVGRWSPRVAGGENLEKMGWLMASSWGLKGKLGLAWLEEGRALLDFELAEEARSVLTSRKRSVGGIQAGLELWNPRMENLRWARILVKPKGGELPSLLEIGVEGSSYYLPLWWEVSPLFRQNSEGYRGSSGRCSGEVRGDGDARAAREWRSGLTQGSRRCHGQLMGRKGRWSGWVGI
ncbi:hypothetical protein CK203_052925 [Vitis vinifera]|uniref:DUF4283 domain-containing protein n=1 Tax=Vitis vinifera TaxID=29760 RepID=A0A438GT21_VITVI|nr:hypothetical protein CK203_052925 [Vitis vinifera]